MDIMLSYTTTTKIADISFDIVLKDILPKIDLINLNRLFDLCLLSNNHKFINDYLISSYVFIDLNSSENNLYRNKIILYIINNLEYYELVNFINSINFPIVYDELSSIDKLWYLIIKRNDINILNYFIKDCNYCKWEAFNVAIELYNEEIMINMIKNDYYPTFENCLLILLNNQIVIWDYIVYKLKYNIEYMYNEVCEYILEIKSDINIYNYDKVSQYLYDISHILYMKNKNYIWLKEQLLIFEYMFCDNKCNLLSDIPIDRKRINILENISNYVIIIDNRDEIDDEINDYDY